MKNGSLLMTSRLESRGFPQFQPDPSNGTDPRNIRRGFARSDECVDGRINTSSISSHLNRWITSADVSHAVAQLWLD
jgi:hypothetical protein